MPLPFFFEQHIPLSHELALGEESSRHIAQVLRMKAGDRLMVTNGEGTILTTEIVSSHKKSTVVQVLSSNFSPYQGPQITLAISPVKNAHRFEWFAEKVTEIGVYAIVPLICSRTEKIRFRTDRIRSILISAMLQSRQSWLPVLSEPRKFSELVRESNPGRKFIGHCLEDEKIELGNMPSGDSASKLILIGPEGDFTPDEIEASVRHQFMPVSLGSTRLRTETAGVVAAVLLKSKS